MRISIVTAAYNGERFLAAALDSVAGQTVADWEHVIVDDGSTDATPEIARSYAAKDPRIKIYVKPNGGVADARNFGYARIDPTSKYVIFLDQDDLWKPHTLERLMAALEADPDAVAAHGLTRQIDADGNPYGSETGAIISWERRQVVPYRLRVCERSEPTTFAVLINHCCIPTPGVVLIRRSAFETAKTGEGVYFDPTVATGDDWDMWLRLSLRGPLAFVDDVLLDWRMHEANGSRGEEVTFASESKVRAKMAIWPELSREQRALAEWRRRRVCASVERHNSRACWRWTCENARGRRWRSAAACARAWRRCYLHYLALRVFGPLSRPGAPIPYRLVDSLQVLNA
jgi:glycosyltransferase involved in cell wall biosynthesis